MCCEQGLDQTLFVTIVTMTTVPAPFSPCFRLVAALLHLLYQLALGTLPHAIALNCGHRFRWESPPRDAYCAVQGKLMA